MKHIPSRDSWQHFLELCARIDDPEEMGCFFDLFLTFEEKEILASRYLIIKALLEKQLSQRQIAGMHKVSIAQITRGSNALKVADPNLKKSLRQMLKVDEDKPSRS